MVDLKKKSKMAKRSDLKSLPEAKSLQKCVKKHCAKEAMEINEVSKVADKSLKHCNKIHRYPKKCSGKMMFDKMECMNVAIKRAACFDKREGLTPSEKRKSKTFMSKLFKLTDCQKAHCEEEQEKLLKVTEVFFKKRHANRMAKAKATKK